MLCSMPEEHVRDGRLQVSNIALNFRQHDTTNISLPLVPCSQDANEHSKQSEITQTLSIVAATERKKEKKQKHKPLLFSNKSWECGGGWGRKRFWDEANWKVFFLYFVVSRSLPHFPNEEKMNKGKWNLMDSQIKIYVFFSSPLFFTKKRIILRHVVLFSMVNFQVFSLLRLSLSLLNRYRKFFRALESFFSTHALDLGRKGFGRNFFLWLMKNVLDCAFKPPTHSLTASPRWPIFMPNDC